MLLIAVWGLRRRLIRREYKSVMASLMIFSCHCFAYSLSCWLVATQCWMIIRLGCSCRALSSLVTKHVSTLHLSCRQFQCKVHSLHALCHTVASLVRHACQVVRLPRAVCRQAEVRPMHKETELSFAVLQLAVFGKVYAGSLTARRHWFAESEFTKQGYLHFKNISVITADSSIPTHVRDVVLPLLV